MSATGRLVRAADGLTGGVGGTGVDPVVTGAEVPAALLAAGAAVPVPGAVGRGVAATAAAVAPEAGGAAPEAAAVAREAGGAAGLVVTVDWEVPDAAGAAARADAAAGLAAARLCGVAVAAGGAWPPAGAAG